MKDLNPQEIRARYGGLKPCLHGSDAHKLEDVATPFGDRFSWIKGGLDFDSLRQACIDPRGRAHVGPEPPASATPSQVISNIGISNAPWLQTPVIPLNAGLVAIIGARGSGKTALADMIAAGCDSITDEAWARDEATNPSFLVRAWSVLGEGRVRVTWGAGNQSTRTLDGSDANGSLTYPRVRYLSQQFVEDLCSSRGMTDELLREIEGVIFGAHSDHDRDGALARASVDILRDGEAPREGPRGSERGESADPSGFRGRGGGAQGSHRRRCTGDRRAREGAHDRGEDSTADAIRVEDTEQIKDWRIAGAPPSPWRGWWQKRGRGKRVVDAFSTASQFGYCQPFSDPKGPVGMRANSKKYNDLWEIRVLRGRTKSQVLYH